jgi:hypothetical protein
MRLLRPFTGRITIAAFIFCSLLSTIRILSQAPNPWHRLDDSVELGSDRRFAALRAALPQQGTIGYIGNFNEPAGYYLAQYALAPLVVDHSSNHALVVGNFSWSQPQDMAPDHLRLLRDFGNGVLLYANKDAQ